MVVDQLLINTAVSLDEFIVHPVVILSSTHAARYVLRAEPEAGKLSRINEMQRSDFVRKAQLLTSII